ncbi:MAG: SWIM zinc finger family protein [Acidimicrobiales bacterium]
MDEVAVLALAPDDASRRAARALAVPSLWDGAAHDAEGAWGRVRGRDREPYRVAVSLVGAGAPAWACSCPSRKQPCKHALGLLLLAARGRLAPGARPPEVEARLAAVPGRVPRAATAAPVRPQEVADPVAQERRRARRQANVEAGVVDLERWLDDLVRRGLAAAQTRPWASWDEAAARLVDAQAPGLASRVRALGRAAHSGTGWPDRLLGQLGHVHLVLEGWRHRDDLPPALAREVRTQIGFPTARADVLAIPPVRDRWDVLAAVVSDDGTLTIRRVWLRGATVGGWVLLLDTGPSGTSFDADVVVGTTVEADVHRYPGAAGQRGLVGERHGEARAIDSLEGAAVADALAADALAVAASPWLLHTPVCLAGVVPVADGAGWLVVDERGDGLALERPPWEVLALSGGHPVTVVGEWDGHRCSPLSCFADGRLWPLAGVA